MWGSTCSWCHKWVRVLNGRPAWCTCGHRADLPRLECDCPRCRPTAAADAVTALRALDAILDFGRPLAGDDRLLTDTPEVNEAFRLAREALKKADEEEGSGSP